MASDLKNLSEFDSEHLPDARGMRIGVVVSEWNTEVTETLFAGAKDTLMKAGVAESDIVRENVPGSYELPLGGKLLAESGSFDAIICIGVVIQGETKHFDFICNAVSQGLMDLNLKTGLPFIFGVLTPNTLQQALDRSGGKHGNKGDEAAVTAVQMAALRRRLR